MFVPDAYREGHEHVICVMMEGIITVKIQRSTIIFCDMQYLGNDSTAQKMARVAKTNGMLDTKGVLPSVMPHNLKCCSALPYGNVIFDRNGLFQKIWWIQALALIHESLNWSDEVAQRPIILRRSLMMSSLQKAWQSDSEDIKSLPFTACCLIKKGGCQRQENVSRQQQNDKTEKRAYLYVICFHFSFTTEIHHIKSISLALAESRWVLLSSLSRATDDSTAFFHFRGGRAHHRSATMTFVGESLRESPLARPRHPSHE